jgi:NTP pyrophosphatase (non-canonical NTP hydrolase)
MNLNEIAENAHRTAITRERNGGAVKIRDILKHTAGEVVEAAQAREAWASVDYIDGIDKEDYAEELADVVICVLIAAYDDNIDIEQAINAKMQKNAQRAALEGDKK